MTTYHPFRSATAKEQYLTLYDIKAEKGPVDSQTRFVDTAYGQTFVRTSGPAGAPPLVLLHGAGGDSLQWTPNIEALSKRYRVYAADNIYDYSRSIYTQIIKNPDDYVKWLDAELRRINVPTLYLVGENEKIYSAQKAIQRLHNVAPHIKAEMIPDAGHDLTIVQADIVNKKVLDFLKDGDA